jgi:hypothetical protein
MRGYAAAGQKRQTSDGLLYVHCGEYFRKGLDGGVVGDDGKEEVPSF